MSQISEVPLVVAPDSDALLRRLGRLLQVSDLRMIAGCDRGNGYEQHFEGLQRILVGDMPNPLRWHPAEVLQLTRWHEPGNLDPYVFEAAHRRHAFACAALLRACGNEVEGETDGNGHLFGPNQTLIQLIASLRQIEGEFDRDAAAFLQWLTPRLPPGEQDEAAFFGLGLFWFALPRSSGASDAQLRQLADWIMLTEDAVSGQWRDSLGASAQRPWLLSTSGYAMRHDVWREFASWLLARASIRPPLREAATLFAASMTES